MITNKRVLNKYIKYFIGFSIVGVLITLTSLLLTIFLIKIVKVDIMIAYPTVYIISIMASYYLNKEHVFKYDGYRNRLFFYFVIYLTSMLLGLLLISVLKVVSSLTDAIIALLVLPFTTIYNFILVSIIFKNKKHIKK